MIYNYRVTEYWKIMFLAAISLIACLLLLLQDPDKFLTGSVYFIY